VESREYAIFNMRDDRTCPSEHHIYWLARLQASGDPYYQSTCLCLSVPLSLYPSVGNYDAKYLGNKTI